MVNRVHTVLLILNIYLCSNGKIFRKTAYSVQPRVESATDATMEGDIH